MQEKRSFVQEYFFAIIKSTNFPPPLRMFNTFLKLYSKVVTAQAKLALCASLTIP